MKINLIQTYNNLIKDTIENGIKKNKKFNLFAQSLKFDLTALNENNSYQMFLPIESGKTKNKLNIAIDEAFWFNHNDNTKRLYKNTDLRLINNYKKLICKNNDLNNFYELFDKFIKNKKMNYFDYTFYLNSFKYQNNLNNEYNKIIIKFYKSDDNIILESSIFANSIDLINDLPYDQFFYNGFLCEIATELKNNYKTNIILKLINFNFANVYIKSVDKPSKRMLNQLNNKVILIDYQYTPYAFNLKNNVKIEQKIKEFIIDAKRYSFNLEVINNVNEIMYHLLEKNNRYKANYYYAENLDFIIDLLQNNVLNSPFANELFANEYNILENQIEKIKQTLKKNKYAKNCFLINVDQTMYYIIFDGKKYIYFIQ